MARGVETVVEVLEHAGFQRLPRPLMVAGTALDFEAAVTGTGPSHDLVIVAPSPHHTSRLVRLMSALSRTLDQFGSTRPVSLVLVGEEIDQRMLTELERHARVLSVGSLAPSPEDVRQAVAVLLPLSLPSATERGTDPLAEVRRSLGQTLSAEHQLLIEAARIGPEAVRNALREYIDAALREEDEGDGVG